MSRLPEQKVWDQFRRAAPEGLMLQRHEDKFSLGIPDVSFMWAGTSGWVELKNASEGSFFVRPAQYAWWTRYAAAGGCVALMARVSPDDWRAQLVPVDGMVGRVSVDALTHRSECPVELLREVIASFQEVRLCL
jgi:hypothetical protein